MQSKLFITLLLALACAGCSLTHRLTEPAQDGFGPREWTPDMVQATASDGNPDFPAGVPMRVAGYRKYVSSACAWCGTDKDLEVHHIIPQHVWADVSWTNRPAYGMNDPENLVTLCRRCHHVVGHRCDFTMGMVTNIVNVIIEANR